MKIIYDRHAYTPAIVDQLTRRINGALAAQCAVNGQLAWNDIASAVGGVMLEFVVQVPAEQRQEVMRRFVDTFAALAKEPETELGAAPAPTSAPYN